MCFTVEASCTHSHTFLKRILLYLYLGSGRVVQQQDSRYSHTSDNTVLHLPEAQQECHDKRQQVQLCGGHTSTQTSNKQTDPRKHKIEVTPTAYPPHLKHDVVIHHGSNRTDDHSSQRSSGDVEEGRHEELQREQHDHTCKTPQREGHIYRNFSFSILINTQTQEKHINTFSKIDCFNDQDLKWKEWPLSLWQEEVGVERENRVNTPGTMWCLMDPEKHKCKSKAGQGCGI